MKQAVAGLLLLVQASLFNGSAALGAAAGSPHRARLLRRHHPLRFHAKDGTDSAATVGEVGPPPPPPLYTEADDVAKYIEKRAPINLVPEGAKMDVDVSSKQEEVMEKIFSETPDIFKHCVLVRDFAAPLRVGSAIMSMEAAKLHTTAARGSHRKTNTTQEHDGTDDSDDDSDGEDEGDAETDEALIGQGDVPGDKLVAKGGIFDVDEAPDGRVDAAMMEVSMLAYLESVAGQVAVEPNGMIAKWSSKRKVPIAGYLCTTSSDPVLHTLETPCLATSLTAEGTPATPPPVGNSDEVLAGDGNAPSPAEAEGAAPEQDFAVYVGSAKLHFTSKKKAARFCHKLAQEIADDPGDNEWDTDKLKDMQLEKDMPVSSFVQLTRKDPPQAWTTGTKKVLVVIMDWMAGDSSKAPLTKQTLRPDYYRDTIFPRVKAAFKEMSYGQFDIEFEVVPEVVRYTSSRSRYQADGWPFPGLYNGATQSLAGSPTYGSRYKVENYDLVYTVSPQQAPTGTKGVAWVGAKGAMCNGCEAISENFQVMVAVHELGHNLGLMHAGSSSLEYGNPFDWMGNYPDVQGLSYGVGYKLKLHWLPRSSVAKIDDTALGSLNDRFILLPFDKRAPQNGEIAGIQLSFKKNSRDIYISYRQTAGKEAGIYVVMQDKNTPDSQLIDMACHSPSQKDARLQPGWTYIDPSSSVVVVVESVSPDSASVHVYRAPGTSDQSAIRARDTFSDGVYKCPRTCTDSDLLLASFDGCSALARDGHCKSGAITMGGKQYVIKTDLCPDACGQCSAVLDGSTLVGAGGGGGDCEDRNIKISGMDCAGVAAKGHCTATTNIGKVSDLCPKSCGFCPPKPSFGSSASASTYGDPAPARTVGGADPAGAPPPSPPPPPPADLDASAGSSDGGPPPTGLGSGSELADDPAWRDSEGDGCEVYKEFIKSGKLSKTAACQYDGGEAKRHCKKTCADPSRGSAGSLASCEDSATWTDKDGDGCEVYAQYISDGRMTLAGACNYGNGGAAKHCPKTCKTCEEGVAGIKAEEECVDKACVSEWEMTHGQCYECAEWASHCNEEVFARDCPQTCGLCSPHVADVHGHEEETLLPAAPCQDATCIHDWGDEGDDCYRCEDYADSCGSYPEVRKSCPRTCLLCDPDAKQVCQDDFKEANCQRYKGLGWCTQDDILQHCKATCGQCAEELAQAIKALNGTATTPAPLQKEEGDTDGEEEHPPPPRHLPKWPSAEKKDDGDAAGDQDGEEEDDGEESGSGASSETSSEEEQEPESKGRKQLPPAFRVRSAASPRGSTWALPALLLLAAASVTGLVA